MKLCSSAALIKVYPLILVSTLLSKANPASAQITPDNTLGAESSTVNPRDEASDSIQGGAVRGQNLFHSFEDFNVDAGRGAYFANPDAVDNIFSRVTGDNASNILGNLGVDGAADLYLINPNGIVFGENSSLDVQGSFTATTADAIEFGEGGLFSAIAPGESLLTISVPLGLQFGSTPGSIVNRSFVQDVGLQVPLGENLTLVGGDINFEAGEATTRGGNIYLGGLAQAGIVGLNEDGTLSLSEDLTLSDITLTNAADIDVRGMEGGSIAIDAQNLSLESGEFGSSLIRGGIASDSTSTGAQSGNIVVNIVENITLNNSAILNQVSGLGNSGNITINTSFLEITGGGQVDASTLSQGDGGVVEINATGDVIASGESVEGRASGILSQVSPDAEGDSGGVTISTTDLNLTDGAQVKASTFGRGNGGAVEIKATGNVVILGESIEGFGSGIYSQVNPDAEGDAGGVTISTTNLNLTDGGVVSASTLGTGDAEAVEINATGNVIASGESMKGFVSGIFSQVNSDAEGDAGGVTISTTNLNLTDSAQVNASTLGTGDAEAIEINATGDVVISGQDSEGFGSGIYSRVNSDAEGNAGGLIIFTNNLNLTDGAQIDASALGTGNAGAVEIKATGDIVASGESIDGRASGILSSVNSEAEGNAGGVTISTTNLNLTDGGVVSASTSGTGNAGAIDVDATGDIVASGENSRSTRSGIFSQVNSNAEGNAGGVSISTNNLNLTDGAQVSTSTSGTGNAGAIDVDATGNVVISGESIEGFVSGIFSDVNPEAEGVTISTNSLNLTDGGQVSASTLGTGNAGAVEINATDNIVISGESIEGPASGIYSQIDPKAEGDSGGVTISTNSLNLTDGGVVSTSTLSTGNAGAIEINATDNVVISGEDSDRFGSGIYSQVNPEAEGDAGGVTISTNSLNLTDGGQVGASTLGTGNAGAVEIQAKFLSIENNAAIFSSSNTNFNAGNITFNVNDSLQATDGIISTSSSRSSGGNLAITAGDIQLRGNSDITTNIASGDGSGGNITVTANSIFAFDDSDIFAFAADGQGGNITLDTPAFFAENFTLNSLTAEPKNLEDNNSADVNATGAVSGAVNIPDVSFIQNSLTELPDNSINTNELVANSCVVPSGERGQGNFIITGGESLPVRPGDNARSMYPTGEVRNIPEDDSSSWQPGDPIVEPQGAYRLANGQLVLSRECSQQ